MYILWIIKKIEKKNIYIKDKDKNIKAKNNKL